MIVYKEEPTITLDGTITISRINIPDKPDKYRGLNCNIVKLINTSEKELEEVNPALYVALKNTLYTSKGKFIEAEGWF